MKAQSLSEAALFAPTRRDLRRWCEEMNRKADAAVRRRGGTIETRREQIRREALDAIAQREERKRNQEEEDTP